MKLSFILCLFLGLCLHAHSQKYVMVWNDEFNTPGLPDSTKWDYEVGKVRNNELQYYTYKRSENARIVDTCLIIEARKEAYQGAAYTSASLISRYKGDWLYGKFEIRAKVPTGRGTWPAIWMMPTNDEYGGWPKSGEIDIMEYVGMNANNLYYTIHFEGTNGTGHQSSGTYTTTTQPYSRFITFTLVWTPEKLEWFADNKLCHTYLKTADDSRVWPFNKLFYMLLNLGYGGNWAAQQGIDDTKLPHKYYIDYVRVYQLQESEGPFSLKIEPPFGGTVEVSPIMDSYPEGTMVTLTAKPEDKFEFDKWLYTGSANPLQIEVSKEITLTPLFKRKNELIQNGDFSLGIKNWGGLYINNATTMAATQSVVDNVNVVNITKPGTANWHIAEQQGNISIEKGATYLISFDAWAENPGVIDVFLSKNHDDWGNYYSTNKNLTAVKQHFTWTVKMLQASDPNCRLGFGIGKFTGNVYFDNVSIARQVVSGIEQTNLSPDLFNLFPNPASDFLDITNKTHKTLQPTVQLYNLQGQLMSTLWENKPMSPGQQIRLPLGDLKTNNGVYLVKLSTPETSVTRKLVINRP